MRRLTLDTPLAAAAVAAVAAGLGVGAAAAGAAAGFEEEAEVEAWLCVAAAAAGLAVPFFTAINTSALVRRPSRPDTSQTNKQLLEAGKRWGEKGKGKGIRTGASDRVRIEMQ